MLGRTHRRSRRWPPTSVRPRRSPQSPPPGGTPNVLELQGIDLLATRTLLLEGENAMREPKKLRYRLLNRLPASSVPPAAPSCASPTTGPGPMSWPPRAPASPPTPTDGLTQATPPSTRDTGAGRTPEPAPQSCPPPATRQITQQRRSTTTRQLIYCKTEAGHNAACAQARGHHDIGRGPIRSTASTSHSAPQEGVRD